MPTLALPSKEVNAEDQSQHISIRYNKSWEYQNKHSYFLQS